MSVVFSHDRASRESTALETPTPVISVVIVNFCQWANTLRLTRQIAESISHANGGAEVIVVDNGSSENESSDELTASGVCQVHRFGENLGFAKAVNEACLRTTGDWILLLNPDTSLPLGFLDNLSAFCRTIADERSRVGVIGLGLRHADGSPQASCGSIPTFYSTLGRLLLPRKVRKCNHSPASTSTAVEWVTGCGMLIRRDCWLQLQGFDTDFFLYYEDVDFCKRATSFGWEVIYEPAILLRHLHPLHTRRVHPALRLMTRHALLNFAFKYWSRWQAKVLARIIGWESRCRSVLAAMQGDETESHQELVQLSTDWRHGDISAANERVKIAANRLRTVMSEKSHVG